MKTYYILNLKNDDKVPIFFSHDLQKNSSPKEKKNDRKRGEIYIYIYMSNQITNIVGCHNYGGFHHLQTLYFS